MSPGCDHTSDSSVAPLRFVLPELPSVGENPFSLKPSVSGFLATLQTFLVSHYNRTLLLDAALCDGLFKGTIKKGETFPTHLPKASLREKFIGRMQAQVRRSGVLICLDMI